MLRHMYKGRSHEIVTSQKSFLPVQTVSGSSTKENLYSEIRKPNALKRLSLKISANGLSVVFNCLCFLFHIIANSFKTLTV